MAKQNCWEFKECGREPGGKKVAEMGVCGAAILQEADGFLDGKNGGRACSYVAGTICGGKVQGEFAQKIRGCFECGFYRVLQAEHGQEFNVMSYVRYTSSRTKAGS
jgi:hypothetical protein